MVAEVPNPAFLVLKHQACRPEVCRCGQRRLACLGFPTVHPSENGSGASAKSSAIQEAKLNSSAGRLCSVPATDAVNVFCVALTAAYCLSSADTGQTRRDARNTTPSAKATKVGR